MRRIGHGGSSRSEALCAVRERTYGAEVVAGGRAMSSAAQPCHTQREVLSHEKPSSKLLYPGSELRGLCSLDIPRRLLSRATRSL